MNAGRGKRLSQTLFGMEEEADDKSLGRDPELIRARDERLCHRYYYYMRMHGFDHLPVMELLSREFDLSVETIPRRIELYQPELQRLKNEKPDIAYFRKKYDWMTWEKPEPGDKRIIVFRNNR